MVMALAEYTHADFYQIFLKSNSFLYLGTGI